MCASDDEGDIEVVDLVEALATKSLLVAELAGTQPRYRLLESSRQYARDKLVERNNWEGVARRHALFYLQVAERLERAWDATPDREWFAQAQVELENWRATLEWALAKRGDVLVGQRFAALQLIGRIFPSPDGLRWVRLAAELVDEQTPPPLEAQLFLAEAELVGQFAEPKTALAAAERALLRYRELNDEFGIAQAQSLAAHWLGVLGRPRDAVPLLQEALEIARSLNKRRFVAETLRYIADALSFMADFAAARTCYSEALALAEMLGAESLAASIVASLASNEYDAGNLETALMLITDALAKYRALGSSALRGLTTALGDSAKYLIALGRYGHARPLAEETVEVAHGLRHLVFETISLQQLAVIALQARASTGRPASTDYAAIARLFGYVEAQFLALGIPDVFGLPSERDRALAALRKLIGADELAHLRAAGATMTEDEAIAQAHALG